MIGRVVASHDVTIFSGDVAEVAYSHIVEPRDRPGNRLIVVTGRSDCPAQGDHERSYEMTIRERTIAYGLTNDEEDRRWVTDLEILSCTPLQL